MRGQTQSALGLSLVVLIVAVYLIGLGGCAGTTTEPAGPRVSTADDGYLRSPLEGYARSVDPETGGRLVSAAAALKAGGSPHDARRVAEEILASSPELEAAQVLQAQAELVEGRYDEVVAAMRSVTRRVPGYDAALLLLGRAAESSGDPVTAHFAYREVGEGDEVAVSAADRTMSEALEELRSEVDQALSSSRISAASSALESLQRIDPDAEATLRAALAVGEATGDRETELEAARRLVTVDPGEFELAFRRAVLEVEVGDAGAGLRLLQELSAANPDEPRVVDQLARARFLWRLDLLPDDVQAISTRQEVSRADFATLLYWLVPSVRYGPSAGGRIATDILDHPRKEEIIRVVNQRLMEVDPGLHSFSPDSPLARLDGLRTLLRLMAGAGTPAGCLGGRTPGAAASSQGVCGAASGCGLIGEDADCLPAAAVDGDWAVEAIRQALNRLGV